MTPAAGIDVVVPCYNYARFLEPCARSVLAEARLPVRVLIIDDASGDDTADVARRLAAQDSRVETIVHGANRGHIATYNEGIAWVRAPYMLLLSADDGVAPGALGRAVTLLEAVPNLAFVYGRSMQIGDTDELAAQAGPAPDISSATVCPGPQFIGRICAQPDNPVETATAVVRTAVLQRVGGYRPELPHAGDLEMWLRCAAQGDVGFLPEVQAYTRIHNRNMRQAYTGTRLFADYEQRLKAFEMFFAHGAARLADAATLERLARRSLAEQALWAAARMLESERDPGARRLVALARRIDQSAPFRPLWWKVLARGALGPRLSQTLARRARPTVAQGTVAATPAPADRRR